MKLGIKQWVFKLEIVLFVGRRPSSPPPAPAMPELDLGPLIPRKVLRPLPLSALN